MKSSYTVALIALLAVGSFLIVDNYDSLAFTSALKVENRRNLNVIDPLEKSHSLKNRKNNLEEEQDVY